METEYTNFSSFREFVEKTDTSSLEAIRNNLQVELSNIGLLQNKPLHEKSKHLFLKDYDHQLYDFLDYLSRGVFRRNAVSESDKATHDTILSIAAKLEQNGQWHNPKTQSNA